MAEKLGVEWNGHNGMPIVGTKAFDISKALLDKMARVFACRHFCRRTIINFFRLIPTGHAVIFNAGKLWAVRGEWRKFLGRQIESNVTVEIAIIGVSGIARLYAPNLPAGIDIARERSRPRRSVARSKCSAFGSRLGVFERMCVNHKPADVLFLQ